MPNALQANGQVVRQSVIYWDNDREKRVAHIFLNDSFDVLMMLFPKDNLQYLYDCCLRCAVIHNLVKPWLAGQIVNLSVDRFYPFLVQFLLSG